MNAPARPLSGTMEVDEFMAFLETRPGNERWQLIEGVAVMMAPPTLAHQRIALNFRDLLNEAVRARNLDLYAYVAIGVRAPNVKNFQPIPDVAVVPGVSGYEFYTERFQLVTEVISRTNTRNEIAHKLRRYREGPEMLYAFTVEQRRVLVEVHARERDWRPQVLRSPEDAIDLPEFGFRCAVGDLYRGTPLDPGRAA